MIEYGHCLDRMFVLFVMRRQFMTQWVRVDSVALV